MISTVSNRALNAPQPRVKDSLNRFYGEVNTRYFVLPDNRHGFIMSVVPEHFCCLYYIFIAYNICCDLQHITNLLLFVLVLVLGTETGKGTFQL
jgi:hypothetical protein